MRRVLGALAFVLAVFGARPAAACSCSGLTPAEAFDAADVVFRGRAIGETTHPLYRVPEVAARLPRDWRPLPRRIAFRVSGVWKGDVGSRVVVSTGHGGGDCGAWFHIGHEYVIHAYRDGSLVTSICSGNVHLADADLAMWADARPPSDATLAWPTLLAALGVAGIAVLGLWRLRTSKPDQGVASPGGNEMG